MRGNCQKSGSQLSADFFVPYRRNDDERLIIEDAQRNSQGSYIRKIYCTKHKSLNYEDDAMLLTCIQWQELRTKHNAIWR
jgi:hypothetical protein